jgi:hypothetical protein
MSSGTSPITRSDRNLIDAPASDPPELKKLASANGRTVSVADAGAAFGRAAVPSRTAIANLVAGFLKSSAEADRTLKNDKMRNSIMYLGMNPDSKDIESKALAKNGDVVRVDQGVDMPLRTPSDIKAFVKTLDLKEPTASDVENALVNCADGKQELASIARAWSAAYHGGEVPSRMILSGHSVGGQVFGHYAGGTAGISFGAVQGLAAAMPKAAERVHDIQLAGCNTAGNAADPHTRNGWTQSFPNLRSMMTYDGTSPSAPVGDLAAWQARTREGSRSASSSLSGMTGNVTTWTKSPGGAPDDPGVLRSNLVVNSDKLKADMKVHGELLRDVLTGKPTAGLTTPDQLREAYVLCMHLRNGANVPAELREAAAQQGSQLLALRFPTDAMDAYYKHNGPAHAEGFACLGRPAPDFRTMARGPGYDAATEAQAECKTRLANPLTSAADRAKLEALNTALEKYRTLKGINTFG